MTGFALARMAPVAAPVAVGGAVVGGGAAAVSAPLLLTVAVVAVVSLGGYTIWRVMKRPKIVNNGILVSDTSTVEVTLGGESGSAVKTSRNNDPARIIIDIIKGDSKVSVTSPVDAVRDPTVAKTLSDAVVTACESIFPKSQAKTQEAI